MSRDEKWLLKEKYFGEKTEVLELLNDFIAFQSRTKFEKKIKKTKEVNTHSMSESELFFAEFCATTMQNERLQFLIQTYGEIVKGFLTDCARLNSGEPLAYVIGSIPFLNTKIFLDSHPLIPRTETEFWVEKVISEMQSAHDVQSPALNNSRLDLIQEIRVLDLCAGSGCIGVAVLSAVPMARVDFAEIDPCHHPTILKNILENNIDPSRAQIFGGDLFTQCTTVYDYILTNPPYIDPTLNRTEHSVKKYEPSIALYGGENGMEIIERIIYESPKFLTKDGTLVIEHEPEQTSQIHELAKPRDFASRAFPDQYGIERYTRLSRKT